MFRRNHVEQTVDRCEVCGSDFVHPVAWQEHDDSNWWMQLRCGDCDARYDSVLSDAAANSFDKKLDRDEGLIARAADRLHGEWRGDEITAFAAALACGLITAEDFAG